MNLLNGMPHERSKDRVEITFDILAEYKQTIGTLTERRHDHVFALADQNERTRILR
jgi:hypothetical protein